MNIIMIETIIFGWLFTIMVYKMLKNPIKELYNYPPKIQKRVMSLEQYKNDIPTQKKKISVKLVASLIIIIDKSPTKRIQKIKTDILVKKHIQRK